MFLTFNSVHSDDIKRWNLTHMLCSSSKRNYNSLFWFCQGLPNSLIYYKFNNHLISFIFMPEQWSLVGLFNWCFSLSREKFTGLLFNSKVVWAKLTCCTVGASACGFLLAEVNNSLSFTVPCCKVLFFFFFLSTFLHHWVVHIVVTANLLGFSLNKCLHIYLNSSIKPFKTCFPETWKLTLDSALVFT